MSEIPFLKEDSRVFTLPVTLFILQGLKSYTSFFSKEKLNSMKSDDAKVREVEQQLAVQETNAIAEGKVVVRKIMLVMRPWILIMGISATIECTIINSIFVS